MGRIAIITGGTSGIGEEFVKLILSSGEYDKVWVVGRNPSKLAEYGDKNSNAVPVKADLSSDEGIGIIASGLKESGDKVGLLINCAGLGYKGELSSQTAEQITSVIDVNCRALSAVCSICLPYMEDGRSGIINVASSAAYLPQPVFAVYAASKSYVLSFTRALARELKPRKIRVTCVCPGPVYTEFIPRSSGGSNSLTGIKKLTAKEPSEVARKSLLAYRKGRGVYSCGASQKLLRLISKIIPHDWILRAIKW